MTYDPTEWHHVRSVEELTEAILDTAWELAEAWYPEGERMEWDDFFDKRLEGTYLPNGKRLALPATYSHPVMKAIKKHITKLRRTN